MTTIESTTDTEEQIQAASPAVQADDAVVAASDEPEEAEAEAVAKDAEAPEADKEKRKGGYQRRIDQLTADKRELEARLAASARFVEPPPFVQKPTLDKFETYEDYSEALIDWKVEQRESVKLVAAENQKQEAQAIQVASMWKERQDAARDAYEDYDAVVSREDLTVTVAMQQAILESERGADLAYWLGKNPDEAKRIAGLGAVAAIRALGKVEDSLPAAGPVKKQLKLSNAPEPIRPVGGGKSTINKKPEDMNFREFKAWREKGGGR